MWPRLLTYIDTQMTDHNMRDEDPDIPVHLDVKCVHPASGIIASLVGHFNDENLEEEVVALSTSERVYISKLKDGVLDWEVYDEAPENTQILDFHLLKNPQNGRYTLHSALFTQKFTHSINFRKLMPYVESNCDKTQSLRHINAFPAICSLWCLYFIPPAQVFLWVE